MNNWRIYCLICNTIMAFVGCASTSNSPGSQSSLNHETWWMADSKKFECTVAHLPMKDFLQAAEQRGGHYTFGEGREQKGYYLVILTMPEWGTIAAVDVWARSLEKCQYGAKKEKVEMALAEAQVKLKLSQRELMDLMSHLDEKNSAKAKAYFILARKKYNEKWGENLSDHEFSVLLAPD